jgi:hypothetical protein
MLVQKQIFKSFTRQMHRELKQYCCYSFIFAWINAEQAWLLSASRDFADSMAVVLRLGTQRSRCAPVLDYRYRSKITQFRYGESRLFGLATKKPH